VASRANPRRLLSLVAIMLVGVGVLASGAPAGDFADDPCGASGDTYICPSGNVGTPYSMTFKLKGDEDLSCASFAVTSGSFPPGLSLGSNGVVSGTPLFGGDFTFYVTVSYTCNKPASDRQFRISINPPLAAALAITSTTVSAGTVGVPYSAALTANVADPKTWSVASGTLPPGMSLGAADGVLSGTPTTAGSYAFAVEARVDDQRVATRSFTLDVREPLTVTGPADPPLEVGVSYRDALKGAGGLRTYAWALTAGAMPPGLTFWPGGAITGRPTTAGEFRFTVTLTDKEGRTATYDGTLTVAGRLAIATTQLTGRVGRAFRHKVVTSGGIEPSLRLKKGPLPGGVRFDRKTGSFVGRPKKAGTWVVLVEAVDAMKVKAKASVALVVAP
jgi:large repetitive protein